MTGVKVSNLGISANVHELIGIDKTLPGGSTVRMTTNNLAKHILSSPTAQALASSSSIVKALASQLQLLLDHEEGTGAVVLADTNENNGYWTKIGVAGAGAWEHVGPLAPPTLINLTITGGDENDLVTSSDHELPDTTLGAILSVYLETSNSGAMTLTNDGGATKPIRTGDGDDIIAGNLPRGAQLFLDIGSHYEIVSYGGGLGNTVAQEIKDRSALITGDDAQDNDVIVENEDGYQVVRFGSDTSMFSGLTLKYLEDGDDNVLRIQNEDGYVLPQLDGSLSGSSAGTSVDPAPQLYAGQFLYGVPGELTSIFLPNILANPEEAGRYRATLFPEQGSDELPRMFDEQVVIDLGNVGSSVSLVVRPVIWDGSLSSKLPMTVYASAAPLVTEAFNVLTLGDSNAMYQLPYLMDGYLRGWNYDPTFVGTLGTSGGTVATLPHYVTDNTFKGECKPGHEIQDFTNAATSTVSPLDIADEADYNSTSGAYATTAARRLKNTLLRASTGEDDVDDIRNGYVIDFEFYRARHGLAPFEALVLAFGTNDITALDANQLRDNFRTELGLIIRRFRIYNATAPIVMSLAGTARGAIRDEVRELKYTQAWLGMMELQASLEDPNLHNAMPHIYTPLDGSINFDPATGVPDPITGVIKRSIEDHLHATGVVRDGYCKANAVTLHNALQLAP